MEEYDDGLDLANIAAAQDLSRQHYQRGDYHLPEEEPHSVQAAIPQAVEEFVREFYELLYRNIYVENANGQGYSPDPALRQEKLDGIQACYEYKFSNISDRYFKSRPWPHPDQISPHAYDDEVFLMLYRELYHRHLYLKLGNALTIEQRIESWDNYLKLFDWLFSDDDETQEIDLPAQWLWDMIDEFVYQSHEFCRYRTKDLKKRTAAELEVLEGEKHVWDTMQVMQTLQRMISRSEINRILAEDRADPTAGKLHSALTLEVGIVNVQYILGYFSLVCMARLHVAVGDFRTALRSIDGLDFAGAISDKVPLYMRVTSCYITLYYMMGFSYMMMRRYTDATRLLSQVIVYLSRTQHLARPYQQEQHTKRSEQMLKLCAMCVSLCPQRAVDDIIMQKLQDKYPDQLVRLGKGEENMYEEFFRNAAPKSIYPCVPNYKDPDTKAISQTLNQQWNTLLQEIRQQHRLPMLRSYLRLYTSISTAKLASFADGMAEEELRAHIMCLKHKTTGRVKDWQTSSQTQAPLAGKVESSSNVDFYVNKGVVHVAETRVAPTFVPYFVKNINKLEKLLQNLKA